MHEISLKRFSHLDVPTPGSRLPCPTGSLRRQLCCTDHVILNDQAVICMQEYSRFMAESSNWFTFWSDEYYWSGGNQFLPALFIFATGFLPAYLAVRSTGSRIPCPAGLQLRFTPGFISSHRQCRHNCRARPQHSDRISKILKNLIPPKAPLLTYMNNLKRIFTHV